MSTVAITELSYVPRAARSELTATLLGQLSHAGAEADRDDLIDRIVRLNLRVAGAIARRYAGRGVDLEDLQQAACHGLMKAILNFDPTQGHDFLTYAVPTIRGEVQRYFRDYSWSVRPPRRIQELQRRVQACINHLEGELGREPTSTEIAQAANISPAEYAATVQSFGCFNPPSLDRPVNDSTTLTIGEAIPDISSDHDAAEARVVLSPLLKSLTPRERRIIYLRFVEDRTQQEIGEEFGVAQMQVSRWLSSILRRLRRQLDAELYQAS